MGKGREMSAAFRIIGGEDKDTGERVNLAVAEVAPGVYALATVPYVWNASDLDYDRGQQAQILADDLTVSMGDVEKLLSDFYWQRSKFYYSGNNITYVCYNTDIDANETDTDWYIWKLTYTGSNVQTKEGPRQGAVDSEPSGLAWNT